MPRNSGPEPNEQACRPEGGRRGEDQETRAPAEAIAPEGDPRRAEGGPGQAQRDDPADLGGVEAEGVEVDPEGDPDQSGGS